ncbi:hypothetical protein Drorol1_Dr00004065 [Drosera rotundifolia]
MDQINELEQGESGEVLTDFVRCLSSLELVENQSPLISSSGLDLATVRCKSSAVLTSSRIVGDPAVDGFEGLNLVYVAAGSDPFDVIANAVKSVERHLQTFSHRERKKMPNMLNWFGWCTWDAFYSDVTAEGVGQGLERGGDDLPRNLYSLAEAESDLSSHQKKLSEIEAEVSMNSILKNR